MLRIGDVPLSSRLMLAPLAGYTDLPFRLAVRSIVAVDGGASPLGLAFTELLCSHAVLKGTAKTLWLASSHRRDQPLGMQLYGNDAAILAQAACWAQQQGASTIDINMGCPVDKVAKKNGGSLLLCHPVSTVELARQVVKAVSIPVTAKIRLGWDDEHLITRTLPVALADVGIAAITVHGRTTQQMFSGQVRLEGIAQVVQAVKAKHPAVPVIGNGDVQRPEDVKRMIDATGCDGVMIGRGALGQPWIFRDAHHFLATGQLPCPLSQAERVKVVLEHLRQLVELRGDAFAASVMSQRISWYSAALQPWPGLKSRIRQMKSAGEMEEYLQAGPARENAAAMANQGAAG